MNIDAAAAASDQLKGLAPINYASQIHTPAIPHYWHHARGEKNSHQSPQVPLHWLKPIRTRLSLLINLKKFTVCLFYLFQTFID